MHIFSQWLVTFNYLYGCIYQFNFEWYACLLTLRNYPWRPTYNGNIVLCKILDVNERDTCPTTKHKQVSRKSKVGIFQLYSCKYVQFFLCQELTLLMVWVNVVHGKRISLYLAVVVCCRDDMLQWYGVYPNGRLRESNDILQIQTKITDELLGKLIHGHIAALVLKFDELGNVLSYRQILAVGSDSSVFSHALGKGCVLLVKSSE